MEWQALGIALQILLLAIGWTLFQRARAELTARAVEVPVLAELKALHHNVQHLLKQLEETSLEASLRLERGCEQARALLKALEESLQMQHPSPSPRRKKSKSAMVDTQEMQQDLASCVNAVEPLSLKERVYRLAEKGTAPSLIARQIGVSEGEVETLLGLKSSQCEVACR